MFAVMAGMILATAAFTGSAGAADAILIEFSSPRCAPCQAMKPTLAQLERLGVPIRHIDVVTEPDLASRYGIRKTPTFIVVSGGKEVTRLVGTQTLAELRAALAIDPSGPLIPTGLQSRSMDDIPAPQTRLAPVNRLHMDPTPQFAQTPNPPQTLTSAAARSPRSEAMPSVSLADAVERAEAATVRLRVHDGHGYGAGTGTIVDTHGDEALVLTCGHLFRETKGEGKIEVDLFVGGQTRTVLGQLMDYDSDSRDIALVVIRPGFQLQAVQLLNASERVQNGQTAFSFGCDRGDDPSRRDTRITGINKYNQHLGVSNLEISGAPIDGRSGGGLFDERGRLIGVCNAADYKGDVGIYAGPGTIQWQLDRVGLAHLLQSPKSPNPPALSSPGERIASLPESNLGRSESAVQPASLIQPSALADPAIGSQELAIGDRELAIGDQEVAIGDQEVIVIVRDRNNPVATSRVMTLQHPTAELMRIIEQQSR